VKITLIIPPSPFLLDEKVFMSLGILKVAAVLEPYHDVNVMDLSGDRGYLHTIKEYLNTNKVDLVGITATTPQLPNVVLINQVIKEYNIPVILGGPHVTLINSAYKKEQSKNFVGRATKAMNNIMKEFDRVVCGDGELAVFKAIAGEKYVDADNVTSELFLTDAKFDELPLPARHLIDVNSYKFTINGKRGLSLIGQLGCPFNCGFCSGRNSPTFRKIRNRTVDNIINEIDQLYKTYDVRAFMFYDDELNVGTSVYELLKKLIDYQKQNSVEFLFRGCVKAELFNEVQAELMAKAGFKKLLVGFESGSDVILKNINKKATKAENTKCIEIARKYGIGIKALMSIGHPGESEQTIKETYDWLLSVKPDEFDVTIITVIPGSKYYDDAVLTNGNIWRYTVNGDSLYSVEVDNFKEYEYYKGVPGQYTSFVYTDFLNREQLVYYRDWLETTVLTELGIKKELNTNSLLYEHSMGQSPNFF
jgi:anaerobic magnesium-protoporphyrin IX monomethyl ester cyclase